MEIKVISGGQIGADIAGLAAAHKVGFETGGWMPYGFRTLLDPLPSNLVKKYGLKEMPTADYPSRTQKNVIESAATIRLAHHWYTAGERLTLNLLQKNEKPYRDVHLCQVPIGNPPSKKLQWAVMEQRELFDPNDEFARLLAGWVIAFVGPGQTLNIAGNADLGIQPVVEEFLVKVFEVVKAA